VKGRGRKSADDTAQFFLFGPIPAKVKKLGLLSVYKFSLISCLVPVCKYKRLSIYVWRGRVATYVKIKIINTEPTKKCH
jgi:hypothetical protein